MKEGFVNKDNVFFWISIAMAGLFTYGKYFVATTELDKVYYALSAMLWIILGLIITYILKTDKLLKEINDKIK